MNKRICRTELCRALFADLDNATAIRVNARDKRDTRTPVMFGVSKCSSWRGNWQVFNESQGTNYYANSIKEVKEWLSLHVA